MFPSQITTDFNIELFIVSIALTNMALRYLLLLMLHSGLSLRRDAWAISRNLPSIHHISTYLPDAPSIANAEPIFDTSSSSRNRA